MASARAKRPSPAAASSPRAAPRGVSAFPPDRATPLRAARLKARADFLAAARSPAKAAAPGLVLQVRGRPERGEAEIGLGFTASRKVGGAVIRNRAKRRLRAAAEAILPLEAKGGRDYVLIARAGTVGRQWEDLLSDLRSTLRRALRAER